MRHMFVAGLPKFAFALKVPVSYFLTGQMELDELVMTEVHRLTTLEAKQALLKLVQAFCDFAQSTSTDLN